MTNKKTIAFYSNPSSLGGSEVYLKALLGNIDRDKYEVLFFCNPEHPIKEWAREQKIEIVHVYEERKNEGERLKGEERRIKGEGQRVKLEGQRIKEEKKHLQKKDIKSILKALIPDSFKLFLGTRKEIDRLAKLFQQYNIDIIHFNDTGCEPPVIAARLAEIKKITGTLHVLPSYEKKDTTWVHRLIEYWSLRSMDKIIAVSAATKKAWLKRTKISSQKIEVIYNGIDIDRFTVSINIDHKKQELGLHHDQIIVGVPARLHPMKGHIFLFEALPKVIEAIPNIKILLIGDGPLREELRKAANILGIYDSLKFLGHREDIEEILHIIDFAVLSSITLETFGLAAVEAMACSKPVIATDFSGFPEVIEQNKTGLLVPMKDADAMADAIIKLAKDAELRQQMGKAGRIRAEALFTIDKMLSKTFQFFEELV